MSDSFIYKSFRVLEDQQTVTFSYEIVREGSSYRLQEKLKFPIGVDKNRVQAALRALHIALGISYYKIFVSSEIVHDYTMDQSEADFWNEVWRNGLGEFLYVNQLKPDKLARFTPQGGQEFDVMDHKTKPEALLGVGGGKDSIVAGELLKNIGLDASGFVMATGSQLGQAKDVTGAMQVPLLAVERTLDKQLLELQKMPGAYSGHVPISLIFGLVGATLATATNTRYVIVANEASASIPQIKSKFGAVNHQWSKSLEFEKQLQNYIHQYICPSITYFSAIRQLSSVAVVKLFAKLPQYFEVFTSDNSVFRIDANKRPDGRWSEDSPKSLSSFILLAPWLDESELIKIFGDIFLDKPNLEKLFLRLVGFEGEPPLDCVGTVEELVLSLNLLVGQTKFADSYLVKLAKDKNIVIEKKWQRELTDMLEIQAKHALPQKLANKITGHLKEELAK